MPDQRQNNKTFHVKLKIDNIFGRDEVVYHEDQILTILKKTDFERYSELVMKRLSDTRKYKLMMDVLRDEFRGLSAEDHHTNALLLEDIHIPEIHENALIYTNDMYPAAILKRVTEEIVKETGKLKFIINRSSVIEGKILPSKLEYREEPVLIRGKKDVDSHTGEAIFRLFFPDDDSAGRYVKMNLPECYACFYVYDLKTPDMRRLRVFSEQKLEYRPYVIEGIVYLGDDFADIGYTKRAKIKMPYFYVHTAHPKIPQYKDHDQLFNALRPLELTKHRLCNYLFSHEKDGCSYLHPNYFMDMIMAFLFSAKFGGYPLHLLIISQPGAGKSTLEEALHEKIEDYQAITEGSGSTLKALIPSFKSTTPAQGSLITSNRLAVIDEFLRILIRIRPEDREHQLAMLNPLLEHKKRVFGSGNSSMEGSMTARMIAVSNPVWGTSNMGVLCDNIDTSFLSRMLIWYIDKKHVEGVHNGEYRKETTFRIDHDQFISFVEYLQSFSSDIGMCQ